MKTAEQIKDENWTEHNQWSVLRKGKRDGIVVLIDNPPCGRLHSPMLSFKIFKDGKLVNECRSYIDMKLSIERLKRGE